MNIIRRSDTVSKSTNSGYLFQAPNTNIVISEFQGTPVLIANKIFSLSNNIFTVYKDDFQQMSTQTTTPMINSANSDLLFGGDLIDQQPTVTANLALQVTGTRNPIQIKRGTYTGSPISTALFSIAGNDVIIGQGRYAPRFVNLGTFLLAGRALQIVSGTLSSSTSSATLVFSFTQNASVTIGSASTVPVFDSINSTTLNYCRLTINSENFISASTSTYLLNLEASDITIGDANSQAPSFTAQRILNAHFDTSNILKGSFAGIGSANEGNLLKRQSTFIILDGVPSFTNIDQIVINNSTVNINSGTFAGIGEKPLVASSNYAVLNIGQTTSTDILTFAANQIINTAASKLNFNRGGISSSSTTLPLIQAIATPITIDTGNGIPTFTAQRITDILALSLIISKGTFIDTTALGTYLKTNGTRVTIGTTITGNVPSFTLDQFDIQGRSVEIISAQITGGTKTNSVIKATTNSQVIIGTATGTPTLTLTAATIIDVTSATLTIYRGVFNGATSTLGTIIKTPNSQITYAAPVTPQINGIELFEVDGGTITIQSGYLIKAAERTSSLIKAFNNPTVVIGQQTATGTALTLIGTTILDISGNVMNITCAAFSGVNGVNPSIKATNSDTINIGIGVTAPTFSCSRAIGINDSVLNIYRGSFSSQTSSIASYLISTTNSAVTVGNVQIPTFTSVNVLDALNGAFDIISASFPITGIDVTASNTVTTIGNLTSSLPVSFQRQKLLSITRSTYETSISIGEGGLAPSFRQPYQILEQPLRAQYIFKCISLSIIRVQFSYSAAGQELDLHQIRNTSTIIGGYGSYGLEFNEIFVINLTRKFLAIQSDTFSRFPTTAETDVLINTYLTIVTIGETTDTDYPTFIDVDTITVTGEKLQDVNDSSTSQTLTFDGYRLFDEYGDTDDGIDDHVYLFYENYVGIDSYILVTIREINNVLIVHDLVNPKLVGVTLIDVKHVAQVELSIVSGTYKLPEETESVGTVFIIYNAITTIGNGAVPQFLNLNQIMITNGNFDIFDGLFAGSSTSTKHMIHTINTSVNIIAGTFIIANTYSPKIQKNGGNNLKTLTLRITKSAGEFYIEKSQFIGISEQTGPFIRLYSLPGKQMNAVRKIIKSTVFSGASFSLEIGQQNAAVIIEEEIQTTQLLLNRFINTQNSQAILIAQDRFNVEVVSNEFDNNGRGLSLGGDISIVSGSPNGTLNNYNTFVNNKCTRAGVIFTNPKLEATPILLPTYSIQNNFFYINTVEDGENNANDIYISFLNSTSSLIDIILNSENTIEVADSTFDALRNLRYADIKVESKPLRFIFSKVTFVDIGLKGKLDEVVSLGPEIAKTFVAIKDISYVGERYVMQTNSDAQIRVVSTVDSPDAIVVFDDIGFLVANRRLIEYGQAELPSFQDRQDLTKIETNNQKIYLNFQQINLKRNALIENITLVRFGRQYGGPRLLNLNIRSLGEAKISNVVVDGRGWVHYRQIREIQKTDKEYERLSIKEEKNRCWKVTLRQTFFI
ncbi:MAG: hypothetical protein EZS28_007703 [Streblomastix strix]|uniref:Uncharacterized protein n=1 Tax=Streblomastix strix TaxID=222440 RepID=A0A5J4WQG7_9EUKA|nr:MAG: hypothetical protein EZS28_007703 [Streblomastix strix]